MPLFRPAPRDAFLRTPQMFRLSGLYTGRRARYLALFAAAAVLGGACGDAPTAPRAAPVVPRIRPSSVAATTSGRTDSTRSGSGSQTGQTPIWW